MAKADIWMPFFIGDYLADTMHLSTERHGAYFLLLVTCWKMGGSLPDDDEQLALITRLPLDRWKESRQVISRFFKIEAGAWTHGRLTLELNKASTRRDASILNGKAGGRPKSNLDNTQDEPRNNLDRNLQKSSSPSPSSLPSNPKQEGDRAGARAGQSDIDRALKIQDTYPTKAKKDGRFTGKNISTQDELSRKISLHRNYPWEEHVGLYARLRAETPENIATWIRRVPDLTELIALRGAVPETLPEGAEEYDAVKVFVEYLKKWSPTAKAPTLDALAAWAVVVRDIQAPEPEGDGRPWWHLRDILDWLDRQKPDRTGFVWRDKIGTLERLRKFWNEGKFEGFKPKERP